MDDAEMRILILAFSRPKVLQAIKCFDTIPGFLQDTFIRTAKTDCLRRGITFEMQRSSPWIVGIKRAKPLFITTDAEMASSESGGEGQ